MVTHAEIAQAMLMALTVMCFFVVWLSHSIEQDNLKMYGSKKRPKRRQNVNRGGMAGEPVGPRPPPPPGLSPPQDRRSSWDRNKQMMSDKMMISRGLAPILPGPSWDEQDCEPEGWIPKVSFPIEIPPGNNGSFFDTVKPDGKDIEVTMDDEPTFVRDFIKWKNELPSLGLNSNAQINGSLGIKLPGEPLTATKLLKWQNELEESNRDHYRKLGMVTMEEACDAWGVDPKDLEKLQRRQPNGKRDEALDRLVEIGGKKLTMDERGTLVWEDVKVPTWCERNLPTFMAIGRFLRRKRGRSWTD